MPSTWLQDAQLLDPMAPEPLTGSLLIEDGRIVERLPVDSPMPDGARRVSLDGRSVAPGFLDLHYHGRLIFLEPESAAQEISQTAGRLLEHGVTGFLPTTVAWPHERLLAHVASWSELCDARHSTHDAAASVLGLHLEGPWIRPEAAGAQPAAAIRPYDAATGREILARGDGTIRMVTFAPEVSGAGALQEELARRGIVGALGHSHAALEHTDAAIAAGASHVTHIFNAMGGLHHRSVGLAGVALSEDRLTCDLICDGVHVHPDVVRLVARAKGDRLALITDRLEPVDAPDDAARRDDDAPGDHLDFGVVHDDGTAFRLADGTLAGSSLDLDRATQNAVRFGAMTRLEAVRAATLTPARILGLEHERGSLQPGARADFAVLDAKGRVTETWLAGERVFAG